MSREPEDRWARPYEADLLQALADASTSKDPRAISHRRVFAGSRWSVQDLGHYGFLRPGIPVASVHLAARVLIGKGLVQVTRMSSSNMYELTAAGQTRMGTDG
jgi:hypothetical protein